MTDALSFRCTGCGECCRRLRVAVTDRDLERLTRASGVEAAQLVEWLEPDAVDMSGEPASFVELGQGRRLMVLAHGPGGCRLLGDGLVYDRRASPGLADGLVYDRRASPGLADGLVCDRRASRGLADGLVCDRRASRGLADSKRCSVYAARPADCRLFPFDVLQRGRQPRRVGLLPMIGCDYARDGTNDEQAIADDDAGRWQELARYQWRVAVWNRAVKHRRRLGKRVGTAREFLAFLGLG